MEEMKDEELPSALTVRENSNPLLKINLITEDGNLNLECNKESINLEENKLPKEVGRNNKNLLSPPNSQRDDVTEAERELEVPDTNCGLSNEPHPIPYKKNFPSIRISTVINNEPRKITRETDNLPIQNSQLPSLPRKTNRKRMFQAYKKKKSKSKACKAFCIGLMATIYVHYITISIYIYNIYRCYTHSSTYFSYWRMNRFI